MSAPLFAVLTIACYPCRASGICTRYVKADLPLLDAQSSHASVFVALAVVAGIGVLSFLFLVISVAIIWQMRKRLQSLERQQWYAVWACMTTMCWFSCMMLPAMPDKDAHAGAAPRRATIVPSESPSSKEMLLTRSSPDAVPGQGVFCCQSGSSPMPLRYVSHHAQHTCWHAESTSSLTAWL